MSIVCKSQTSYRDKSLFEEVRESKSKNLKSKFITVKREFDLSSSLRERAREKVSRVDMLVEMFSCVTTSRANTAWALYDTGKPSQPAIAECGL
jgi:hypothetical protein